LKNEQQLSNEQQFDAAPDVFSQIGYVTTLEVQDINPTRHLYDHEERITNIERLLGIAGQESENLAVVDTLQFNEFQRLVDDRFIKLETMLLLCGEAGGREEPRQVVGEAQVIFSKPDVRALHLEFKPSEDLISEVVGAMALSNTAQPINKKLVQQQICNFDNVLSDDNAET